MARIRTIKPEFWSSPDIGDVSRDARLTFIGLWNQADDHGRLECVPAQLAGTLFPYDGDIDASTFCGLLNELGRQGLIAMYAQNRRAYLSIPSWEAHQKIDKRSRTRCPDPDDCRQLDAVTPTIAADLSRATPTDSADPRRGLGGPSAGSRGDSPRIQGVETKPSDSGENSPNSEPSAGSRRGLGGPSGLERGNVGTWERRNVGETHASDGGLFPDSFATFWESYPRHATSGKHGGGASKAKTRDRFVKLSDAEQATACDAVANYAEFIARKDSPFPCHATTWITERRWDDWLTPAKGPPPDVKTVHTFQQTEGF